MVCGFLDFEGLDGVQRHVNGKTSGHRVHRVRQIHQQQALSFDGSFDVGLAVRSPDDAGNERQGGFELLFGERQGLQKRESQLRRRGVRLLGDHARLLPNQYPFPHHDFCGQDDLEEWGRLIRYINVFLFHGFVAHRRAGERIASGNEARKREGALLIRGLRNSLVGQNARAVGGDSADSSCNRLVLLVENFALQGLGLRPCWNDGKHDQENHPKAQPKHAWLGRI